MMNKWWTNDNLDEDKNDTRERDENNILRD